MQRSDKVFNILHVVSKLPVGGVENMLLKIVKGYDKKRFNVSVCCLKEGGEIADEFKKLGYKVEILNGMQKHGFDLRTIIELYKFIKKENIHILRTHQYHANLYGRIAGILAGIPVIIPSFHNLYESPNKPKVHRRFLNYILGFFSDTLVAVSRSVASDMHRYDRINTKKIKVIYNGIEIDKFEKNTTSTQEARKTLSIPPDLFVIGSAGRLTKQKGHRLLIEAVSGLKDTCIAIAGDGPLKYELKNLAVRYNVNCIFMGQMSPEKIPTFLRSLDIFCFPSLWEGFGTALIEAMASGLPVVASDIPPHREVIGDAGILIPPGDTERRLEALRMLIGNPLLRETLGKKAREQARIFSIENTVKAYEGLFEEILRNKGML